MEHQPLLRNCRTAVVSTSAQWGFRFYSIKQCWVIRIDSVVGNNLTIDRYIYAQGVCHKADELTDGESSSSKNCVIDPSLSSILPLSQLPSLVYVFVIISFRGVCRIWMKVHATVSGDTLCRVHVAAQMFLIYSFCFAPELRRRTMNPGKKRGWSSFAWLGTSLRSCLVLLFACGLKFD